MEISQYIDHTLLKADATAVQIKTLCSEAIQNNFKTVCINSHYIPFAHKLLKDSQVGICTVVGFPLGASPKEVKALEASMAITNGAKEIDMVINISALKDELYSIVENDIKLLVETCHSKHAKLKVIIETCLLTDEEKIMACELAARAGADYVKTSTGFSTSGATESDIKLMRKAVGPDIGVKASGGIRDRATADIMINAGATRLGTSSGILIVKDEVNRTDSSY
jgi:deoxyribose-phosphate aldolase